MIAKDKIYHFIAGFIICLIPTVVLNSPLIGIILAIVAGVGKEYYDSFYPEKHIVDKMDAIWTIFGSFPVVIIYYLALIN